MKKSINNIIFLCFIMISSTLLSQDIRVLDFNFYENNVSETIKNEKPTIIYINTDWCSICKIQKHQLNKEKELVKELNNDFLVIGLNAEKYTKDIVFLGKNYTYYPNGNRGLHELAYHLSDGSNAYPVWVFFNKKGRIIAKIHGLISNKGLKTILSEMKTDTINALKPL